MTDTIVYGLFLSASLIAGLLHAVANQAALIIG
jgi:hypothetical protein